MARTFSGTTNRISFSIGALGFAFGPGTVAAILRRTTDATLQVIAYLGTDASTGNRVQFGFLASPANTIQLRCGTATCNSTLTVVSADGWVLVGATKATGTVAPRFHKYVYSTNTWTHQNSATTEANSGTPATTAYLGDWVTGGNCFVGDLAMAAWWNVVLTDQQFEDLAYNLTPWFAPAQPKALWQLDQQATAQLVPDLSGGGANQSAISGTAVSTQSVPIWTPGQGPVLA